MENLPANPNQAALPAYLQGKETSGAAALISMRDSLPKISIRGSRWTLVINKEKQQHDSLTLPVIVLGVTPTAGNQRVYYIKGYSSDDVLPPDCSSANGLVPDPENATPVCHSCSVCPNNVFGSDVGPDGIKRAGKACKESKKLLVVPVHSTTGQLGDTLLELNVPVTSLPALSAFGRYLTKNNFDSYDVITVLGFAEADYPMITFTHGGYMTQEIHDLAVSKALSDDVLSHIVNPADVSPAPLPEPAVRTAAPTPAVPESAAPITPTAPAEPAAPSGPIGFGFSGGATATPADPAAPAVAPDPIAPTGPTAAAVQHISKDGRGIVWNPEMHATCASNPGKGGPSFTQSGGFQKKRGVDAALVAQYEAQFQPAAGGSELDPNQTAPATTPPPEAATTTVTTAPVADPPAGDAAASGGDFSNVMKKWGN